MSTTIPLTITALKMFLRNRQALFFTLFTPLMIMLIFGAIGFNTAPKIDLGIVADAPDQATQTLIGQLKQIPTFTITAGTESDERAALTNGDRAAVLLLPSQLYPAMGSTQSVTVLINEGQQQQAAAAVDILTQLFDKLTFATLHAPTIFQVQTQTINANNLRYIDFLLPGIVALAIMQMSIFSVAFVFADYREKGILKRLLATPMRPYQFVAANVFTRLLVAIAQAAILIAVGVLLFQSKVVGSYWLILLITFLGAIMFLGMGFTISGLAKTVESVPAIANLVVFPMLFLGGTFFPISSMPGWLQIVAKYLPLTHFSDAMRQVMTKGAGVTAIGSDLIWMAAWAIVLVVLAQWTFSFETGRQ